jgi:hypothetical protein
MEPRRASLRLFVDPLHAKALALLQPICVSFAGEPDGRDIVEARELLNELARRTDARAGRA